MTWPATVALARELAEQAGNDLIASGKMRDGDAHRLHRAAQRVVLQGLIANVEAARASGAGGPPRGNAASCAGSRPRDWGRGVHLPPVGSVHEAMLSLHPGFDSRGRFSLSSGPGHARKSSGAYYTPDRVVERLLDLALMPALRAAAKQGGERGILGLRVCDPSCGTGNFLVAAARRMAESLAKTRSRAGAPSSRTLATSLRDVMRHCIFAVDVNEVAVGACRALLEARTGGDRTVHAALERNIVSGDALTMDWAETFPHVLRESGGFDIVIGNPPFLNQLEAATVHDRQRAAALKARFGPAAAGYADPSALFLLLASRIARRRTAALPGGRVVLIQPQSLLAARDRAAVRAEVLADCSMESLWIAGERVFDAGVLVCCPVLRKHGPRRTRLRLYGGRDVRPLQAMRTDSDELRRAPTWAPLAAAALGLPDLDLPRAGTLGDIAAATADFRDQFYGLKGCVVEDHLVDRSRVAEYPPLITTGLIDLAASRWETRSTKVAGSSFAAPRVDLGKLGQDPALARWARARLVPKVLLATQTRVLEAVVDPRGEWIPAVPVVTVVPRQRRMIWHIAAVLLSPVASIWALREYGGSGLSATAIKLSAKQAMLTPIPAASGRKAWDDAAKLVARAHRASTDNDRLEKLHEAAALMVRAYGLSARHTKMTMNWWRDKAAIA